MTHWLWLIPVLPFLAAGFSAVLRRSQNRQAAALAIVSMGLCLLLSVAALISLLAPRSAGVARQVFNFQWFELATQGIRLGWVLDPVSAVMLVMVSLVGLMIFIYSLGYMAEDPNSTRFFCFLSLFAGAMLGLVISNSLLLLFICWELVGLASYLLIGFWFQKPSAAAAAKKAFLTTRVGDLAFLLGMVWLYSETGTVIFYDNGVGCLEHDTLSSIATKTTLGGLATSTAIGLLVFLGAMGKSGQVPLHVWLPDAMEGPTPVSALIHAATMVAAGVFLVARLFPLMAINGDVSAPSTTLQFITWTGAITAIFGAAVAVAQNDIKRILAYSTVSQLGYMMVGLAVGGVAVGMFHLLTHAFFKALLFMGAGSVIHGAHGEQDIRKLGGLRRSMPVTFALYAIGMLALTGFPLLFSGFWSKDSILHAAHGWPPSRWPFYLGVAGAFLTAFYMTRQVCLVFFGAYRGARREERVKDRHPWHKPHESPGIMLWPMAVLGVFAVGLGFLGTPAWPWLDSFLEGRGAVFHPSAFFEREFLALMLLSAIVVLAGIAIGYGFYGRRARIKPEAADPLEALQPDVYRLLERKLFFDEIYDATVVRFHARWSALCASLETWVFRAVPVLLGYATWALAWLNRLIDEYVINRAFDRTCCGMGEGASGLSRFQNGRVHRYLRALGIATVALVLLSIWGCSAS